MKKFQKLAGCIIGIAVCTFVSVVIFAEDIYRTSCSDGWHSPSIGKRGACSWHGGVVTRLTDYGIIVLVISIIWLIILCIIIDRRNKASAAKNDERQKQSINNLTPMLPVKTCPKCQSRMALRKGPYGLFYGCKRFPMCKGTLPHIPIT